VIRVTSLRLLRFAARLVAIDDPAVLLEQVGIDRCLFDLCLIRLLDAMMRHRNH
jgi:hypothetical protein